MNVRDYTFDLRQDWNDFNAQARNGHFLFDRGFMEYHSDRFVDASVAVYGEDDELLALFPANIVDDRIYSHQGLTFGGLVAGSARLPQVMRALDITAEAYRSRGAKALIYKPMPHIYHRRPAEDALYWLTRNGARLIQRDVSSAIILASPGPVSSRRKRGADKAAKRGLRFERSTLWPDFWTVLETTLNERHGVRPVHSLAEIQHLARAFPFNICLHVALHEADVVAGVVTFTNGSAVHAQYIAASIQGREMGALDGLFRKIISASQENGAVVFDFGISTEQKGNILNEGLITQKEEFGASAIVHDVYMLDL